jgi:hypothetical protein
MLLLLAIISRRRAQVSRLCYSAPTRISPIFLFKEVTFASSPASAVAKAAEQPDDSGGIYGIF